MTEYTEINGLEDEHLLCKALWNHAWENNPSAEIDTQLAKIAHSVLCIRCTRCYRERYDYLGFHGQLIGRYYRNPLNFPRTHRTTADVLRAELIRRSLLVQRLREPKKRAALVKRLPRS